MATKRSLGAVLVLAIGCGDGEAGTSTGDGPDGSGAGAGSGASSGSGAAAGQGGGGNGASGSGGDGAGGAGNGGGPCGSFLTFEDGKSPSVEIHVATTGSDSSGNGSAGSPYATIERAVQDAAPGSAVVVHEGTYSGDVSVTNLSGTDQAPIWIGGAPGEARPVLQGGPNGVFLRRVRHLVVHDLEITEAQYNGINCDDDADYANPDATRFVVFRDLYVHDIGANGNEDCLKLSGLDDFWVLDSHLARCGGGMAGSGIDHVGCHDGVVARNLFEQMAGNAVQCKGGSADIDIVANRFVDGGARAINMGGSTGFEFFRPPLSSASPNAEARNIRAIANIVERGHTSIGFVGCVDCLAANNTIIDPENWVIRILQETTSSGGFTFEPSSNGRLVNNLVYFRASDVGVHVSVGGGTAPETFSFETNLWYAYDSPGQSAPNLPVAEAGGIVGQDPALADPASGDAHLGPASPAAGAGTADAALHGDFDGTCFAAPPAIGALEPSG